MPTISLGKIFLALSQWGAAVGLLGPNALEQAACYRLSATNGTK